MPPPPDQPTELGELTDLCVKCGLCLPHCPTYGLKRQEGDSPRGRIALIQGLAAGRLTPDDRLMDHVAGCLTCRSCETVCPAKVPYGEIVDRGKALIRSFDGGKTDEPGALRYLARRPGWLRAAPRGLAFGRALGLPGLARRLAPRHWLTRALALRPPSGAAPRTGSVHEPDGPTRGEALLFLGCVARGLDGATLAAAADAVTALGFRVRVPAGQGCCGALDLHGGRAGEAAAAAARNATAFAPGDAPVLCAATGCALTLSESEAASGSLAARTIEITRFVARHLGDRRLFGPPRPQRVAVHLSCTARLLPGGGEELVAVLRRIPNLEVMPLTAARCCGAAGHHFLTRGAQADALRAPLLAELTDLAPDLVASANAGCALHLAAGLGAARPVLHPVALVARALRNDW